MTTTAKPFSPTSLTEVQDALTTVQAEVKDIREQLPLLNDGNAANNASALREIGQSLLVIGSRLAIIAAGAAYVAQTFGLA